MSFAAKVQESSTGRYYELAQSIEVAIQTKSESQHALVNNYLELQQVYAAAAGSLRGRTTDLQRLEARNTEITELCQSVIAQEMRDTLDKMQEMQQKLTGLFGQLTPGNQKLSYDLLCQSQGIRSNTSAKGPELLRQNPMSLLAPVDVKGTQLPVVRHIIAATSPQAIEVPMHSLSQGMPSVVKQDRAPDVSDLTVKLLALSQKIEGLKANTAGPQRTKKLHGLFDQLKIPEEIKSGICEEIGRKASKQQASQQRVYGKEHFADSLSALQSIIQGLIGKIQESSKQVDMPPPSRTGAGGLGQAHFVKNSTDVLVGNRVDSTDVDYEF